MRIEKSATDLHWHTRSGEESDSRKVNIADLAQRSLENEFLFRHVGPNDRVLEVGCGNGYLTKELRERVSWVDAFDFSENMVQSAKSLVGQSNNRFFVESLLSGRSISQHYDVIVCVRVLINLKDLEEQCLGVANMAKWLKPGGRLLLVEGFSDGFGALNQLRAMCGLAALKR